MAGWVGIRVTSSDQGVGYHSGDWSMETLEEVNWSPDL